MLQIGHAHDLLDRRKITTAMISSAVRFWTPDALIRDVELLAMSGMAAVLRVQICVGHRCQVVVLRVMERRGKLVQSRQVLERLEREDRALRVPQLLFIDEDARVAGREFAISEYVEGTPFNKVLPSLSESDAAKHIEKIGRYLRELHQSCERPVRQPGPPIPAFSAVRIALLDHLLGEKLAGILRKRIETAAPEQADIAPVHGDPTVQNIILAEGAACRPVLVDWEHAHFGDRYRDLACFLESTRPAGTSTQKHLETGYGIPIYRDRLDAGRAWLYSRMLEGAWSRKDDDQIATIKDQIRGLT